MRGSGSSLLVLSLGNTSVRAACAANDVLSTAVAIRVEADALDARIGALVARWRPGSAASCGVNPAVERRVTRLLRARGVRLARVGVELRPNVAIRYRPVKSVGADRVAGVCGGLDLSPPGCIVVDCGTAITVNVGSPSREFLGGAIAPGLGLASRALANGTQLLPSVRPARAPAAPARSTHGGIALGVLAGTAGLVDRLVEECTRPLDFEPAVFLTGGDARTLSPLVRTKHRVVPDLVLRGVLSIYRARARRSWNSSSPS
ncbi:MAG: type III pantothenate kinase [Planctomycetes bacterium]|nr:type III pantothenate kinase [Planctomycetota bacterium]MBI3845048.1 type III pantothenate kinase [Planctomycetota bacterium]